MPILSVFFGIVIKIYYLDHNPPHIHVIYGEYEAIYEIYTGKKIQGRIPQRAEKLFQEWRKLRTKELQKAWDDAQKMKPVKRIKPLE